MRQYQPVLNAVCAVQCAHPGGCKVAERGRRGRGGEGGGEGVETCSSARSEVGMTQVRKMEFQKEKGKDGDEGCREDKTEAGA